MDEQMKIPNFTDEDKVEAVFHNFNENPEVVGKLKSIESGSYGDQYLIDTPDGEITVGTYDVLKSKINQSAVGRWIKIKYVGMKVSPTSRRNYKDFEVFIK